jgi:hypothetical protein
MCARARDLYTAHRTPDIPCLSVICEPVVSSPSSPEAMQPGKLRWSSSTVCLSELSSLETRCNGATSSSLAQPIFDQGNAGVFSQTSISSRLYVTYYVGDAQFASELNSLKYIGELPTFFGRYSTSNRSRNHGFLTARNTTPNGGLLFTLPISLRER